MDKKENPKGQDWKNPSNPPKQPAKTNEKGPSKDQNTPRKKSFGESQPGDGSIKKVDLQKDENSNIGQWED